jgi:hypothetical protein
MSNIFKKHIYSLRIRANDIVVPKNSNLFIGGISGRTGTTWLAGILRLLLKDEFVVMGENGAFVLSQLRNAGYEYYQVTPGSRINKESYLRYFYRFVTREAYCRRKIYGQGLTGFRRIVPRRAIRLAFELLKEDLREACSLQECNVCFGTFYSRILNFHSLSKKGTLNWVSKEPTYGRHIRDLYQMIPDCRVTVMVRDGRDTALSMARRGWCNGDFIRCVDRWRDFTCMTLDSLEDVPAENYLLVNYEQMVVDFDTTLSSILKFYGLEFSGGLLEQVELKDKHAPRKNNFGKWKLALTEQESAYFEQTCADVMGRLRYEI